MGRLQHSLPSLPILSSLLGAANGGATPQEQVQSPQQVRIKVEEAHFKGLPLKGEPGEAMAALRAQGLVSGDQARTLRTIMSAAISTGTASIQSTYTITTLDGVGGRVEGGEKDRSALETTFLPRVSDGKIQLKLRLVSGNRVNGRITGATVERTILVSAGEEFVVIPPGTSEASTQHLFFIRTNLLDAKSGEALPKQ